jgi:pimeloyl-ACP methyl ester carboxylesterase
VKEGQNEGEASMATFVLVHGAWFGGWCWQKVIPFLEAAGHEVYAPTLTGLAERASELSPDVGLDTHVQDVVGLLEEKNLHGVILVGHSYGAMVITGVVDQVPERVAHLVYLDTFMPRDGESMADVSPIVIWLLRKKAQAHGDGLRVNSRGTYGVTTEPDLSWVLSKVTPQPLKTFEQPLHLKNPAIVSAKPRTHIDCTAGGFFRSLMRRILARRALPPTEAGWRLRQLPTGHDAMITMPRELADLAGRTILCSRSATRATVSLASAPRWRELERSCQPDHCSGSPAQDSVLGLPEIPKPRA